MNLHDISINTNFDYPKILEVYSNLQWIQITCGGDSDYLPCVYDYKSTAALRIIYDDYIAVSDIKRSSIKVDDFEDYILISFTYRMFNYRIFEYDSDIIYTWVSYKINKRYSGNRQHYLPVKNGDDIEYLIEVHDKTQEFDYLIYDFKLYKKGEYQYITQPHRFSKTKSARK